MTTTVVVGAGSSGGALAARLSADPDQHVILIEAGPDYADDAAVPEGLRALDVLDMAGHDWGMLAHTSDPPVGDPKFPYLRSRVVGGSSTITVAAMRPIPEDFEAWVAAGNDDWSWEIVLPYFRKLENDLDYGDSPIHGNDGPIPVKRAQPDEWPSMMRAFEAACNELGHPSCPDSNEERTTGVGPAPRNMIGTERASSLSTYLRAARKRPNLEIRAETYVDRVVFDGRRAIGVEARGRDQDRSERVLADRVVLCAGSIKTPQILMLSGIGPGEQLRRLGIDPLVELPVGRVLIDHPAFNLLGFSSDPAPSHWGPRVHLQYSSEQGSRNDIWVRTTLIAPGPMLPLPDGVKAAVALSGVLGKPRSAGSLELGSADPSAQPTIRLNYLDDATDREQARAMIRMLYRMATESPLADEISAIIQPGAEVVDDDETLDEWLRESAGSTYHAACTCPLGLRESGRSVVDQQLAVHNTESLYVADASVMPEIPTNATNLACFMIAERLADQLKR